MPMEIFYQKTSTIIKTDTMKKLTTLLILIPVLVFSNKSSIKYGISSRKSIKEYFNFDTYYRTSLISSRKHNVFEPSNKNKKNEVNTACTPTNKPYRFVNLVGASKSGTTITKTSETSWMNAGGTTNLTLSEGDYITYSVTTGKSVTVGLSSIDQDCNNTTIENGLYTRFDNKIYIYENGVNKFSTNVTYTTSSLLKILIEDNKVKYYCNGNFLYQKATSLTSSELVVDFSMYEDGSQIKDLQIYKSCPNGDGDNDGVCDAVDQCPEDDSIDANQNGIPDGCDIATTERNRSYSLTNTAGISTSQSGASTINTISKTTATAWSNSGGSTNLTIEDGGFLTYKVKSNVSAMMGLSVQDSDKNFASIGNGLYTRYDNKIYVYEMGVNKSGIIKGYTEQSEFKISYQGGRVKYFCDGGLIYVSSTTYTNSSLVVDFSLYDATAQIIDLQLFENCQTNTIVLASGSGAKDQDLGNGLVLNTITYDTTGATGVNVTGLPTGVSGDFSSNHVTISGTPTQVGTFPYTVNLTGGCGTVSTTGTISVHPLNTIVLNSSAGTDSQELANNTPLTTISYAVTGATGASVSGLPSGVSSDFNSSTNEVTITGTPTEIDVFDYIINLTGGYGTVSTTGTITVHPINTIELSSAQGTNNQTLTANSTLTDITYDVTGATSVTISPLPQGVTFTYSNSLLRIAGAPSETGTFNYTVTLIGGFGTVTTTGAITVNAAENSGGNGGESPISPSDQNYILTKVYKKPSLTSIPSPTHDQAQVNITYFDGLGRPMQQIAGKQSNSGKDIVTHIEYDAFGRQDKEYLPFASSQDNLNYIEGNSLPAAIASQYQEKYGDTTPFSQKDFEDSPLNRVLKQAAPGEDWKLDSGHEIKFDYQTNGADEVKLFKVSLSGNYNIDLIRNGFYVANELYKTITHDENDAVSEEFKDKEGRVVMKRTYGSSSNSNGVESDSWHETYYVYDVYGNLTYVIPPKASDLTIDTDVLDNLCYQYEYDYRNRLIEKKLPSKQWEFIVYDKLDRPVATGPALSPFGDSTWGWMITKYDIFNRPVYTGWKNEVVNNTTRESKQGTQNALTTFSESKTESDNTIDGKAIRYSNAIVPTDFKLLTVNYYDNYNFPEAPEIPNNIDGQFVSDKTKGLATGSWTRVVTSDSWISGETNTIFYDKKGRVIENHTKNYLGGYTVVDSKLDEFSGQLNETITKHKRTSGQNDSILTIKEVFTYDNQDRLDTHTHQINGGTVIELLAKNTYDELGQLKSKNVGNTFNSNPLQKVDYTYNIRGWLTEINKIKALQQAGSPKDLFGFKINYNTIEGNENYTNKLYNGNIAETFWQSGQDGDLVTRAYGYQYDQLNRLTYATYQKSELTTHMYDENLTYDKNGNIITLKRKGGHDEQIEPFQIDDLTYDYDNQELSNQLIKVSDGLGANKEQGFKDGINTNADYGYDDNGNLKIDLNKGISNINYNHLNLPTKITFGTAGTIDYFYNATGQKVKKVVNSLLPTPTIITTDYLGGFQYKDNVLQYFPHAEGYVKNTPTGGANNYSYVYNYTDHLGNVRVSYEKDITGSLKIIDENNYYPFGLKHQGYNPITPESDYKFKFQNQEFQDELGLNWYSFKWRNYMPDIGRFFNPDPLSEKYPHQSHYVFSENRVIDGFELEGLEVVLINPTKSASNEQQKAADQRIANGAKNISHSNTLVTVTAHGRPERISNDVNGTKINSGAGLNAVLTANSDAWKNRDSNEGMTVVLYSCRTGSDVKDKDGKSTSMSVAQKISASEEFKDVEIIAPDQRVYFTENGPIGSFEAQAQEKNDEYKLNSDGSRKNDKRSNTTGNWNVFKNGELIRSYQGDWQPTDNPSWWDKLTKEN